MKGSEEGGGSGRGGNGGSSNAEPGALFPRLHVQEIKRVGPRAPPRNKMALYEQFTFPSNRFVPPSLPLPSSAGRATGSTSYGSQRSSSYEGSMYYCPPGYAGMPWLPYMAMNSGSQLGGQPSLNGSCSSTIVDGEGDSRRAPGAPPTESARPSSNAAGQGSQWTSSHSNVGSISSKKARSNDDCTVPTYTAPNTNTSAPRAPTMGSDQSTWRTWQQPSAGTRNHPPSVSYDHQTESPGGGTDGAGRRALFLSGGTGDDTAVSMEISRKEAVSMEISRKEAVEGLGDEEQSEQQGWGRNQEEENPSRMQKSHPGYSHSHAQNKPYRSYQQHRRKKSLQLEDASDAEGLRSSATGSGECSTVVGNDPESGVQQRNGGTKTRTSGDSQSSDPPATNMVEAGISKKEVMRLYTDGQKSKKSDQLAECRSSSYAKSDDEIDSLSDAEVPERSQSEVWSDSEEPDVSIGGSETSPKRKITSEHLLKSIGEQEFWRARKLLQRQQKIFSGQVFELHRLMKVQQLLATSPNLLIEDAKLAAPAEEPEETDKADEPVKAGQPGTIKHTGEECRGAAADDIGLQETQNRGKGIEPDSTCQSSTSSRVCLQPANASPPASHKAAQIPNVLNVPSGATTVPWGVQLFPKADVNHWYGSMPATNGGFMYQPYPGPYHPSQAHAMGGYNGSFRPLMCPPMPMDMPSMAPFGMPGYEQRPESMQDMYRFNSYQQQWQAAAIFCPTVPSNPGAAWYGMPRMPYMDSAQRCPPGMYDGMMVGSHPSGPPNFAGSAHQSNAQKGSAHQSNAQKVPATHPASHPTSHPMSSYLPQSPWTSASSQQAGSEGGRFRAQSQWPSPVETSAPSFQRPSPYSSGQDVGASGSQQAGGVSLFGWQCRTEDNPSEDVDSRPAQVAAGAPNLSSDKSDDRLPKRSRDSNTGARDLVDGDADRRFAEGSDAADGDRDALPLFPLFPPLYSSEKGKSSGRSPSGVIKVVPRAMVATPESAAEILLSIQKPRER